MTPDCNVLGNGAAAGPAQLNTPTAPEIPAATRALRPLPRRLGVIDGVGADPFAHLLPPAVSHYDDNIPDPSSMSLTAMLLRGWQCGPGTRMPGREPGATRLASGGSRLDDDRRSATHEPSSDQGQRAPVLLDASEHLQYRRRLMSSLQGVILMLNDNDVGRSDEGLAVVDCVTAEALAKQ
jgi:hypothetical protein